MRRIGQRSRVAAPLAALVAVLAGALMLQLLSGRVHERALGPAVLALSVGLLGGLIRVYQPQARFAALLTLTGIGFGVGTLAASALDYGAGHRIPQVAAAACFAAVSFTRVLVATWVLFIVWFPDGRFTSRRWRRFAVAATGLCAAVALVVWLVGPEDRVFDFYKGTAVPAGAGGPFAGAWPGAAPASDVLLLLPLISLAAMVQRFRRGDSVLRQQVRWLLWGAGVTVCTQIVGATLAARGGWVGDAGLAASIVTQPLPMLAATIAILRYRLWDIDVVISRALAYGLLWAGLSALLLAPAAAAGLLVGGRSAGTAVGIALLVTIVFHPARKRLEALAERVVYRHRARPYVLLSGFWETLRGADLDRIGPLVAEAVRGGLHVEWAALWLLVTAPAGSRLRPLGAAGTTLPNEVAVSAATLQRLREARTLVLDGPPAAELDPIWPAPPEAVVPLVVGDQLVGLLACGGRRGDRLRAGDFELLEMLARECALRLRNLRLEAQLRDRLTQIEAQAAELSRSRQRLVTAQDEERRRIERNLHDGVQQQLVSLAARLHRAAANGSPQLVALAAEAEHAVFALQELGRGIYPSVLADQGLPAALRTQATRMPATVRIDVDDALIQHRLDRDTEAALYFVALEALTNAHKHAPTATISIWLHDSDGQITLDVVDTGPGFTRPAGNGSGLTNMHDRVAAIGGSLNIDSVPGRGTRISASVPAAGEIPEQHQPVPADSRK